MVPVLGVSREASGTMDDDGVRVTDFDLGTGNGYCSVLRASMIDQRNTARIVTNNKHLNPTKTLPFVKCPRALFAK